MRFPTLAAALICIAGAADAQEELGIPELDPLILITCLEQATTPDRGADCIGLAATECSSRNPGGETTFGMSACLGQERDWWDARLNETYGRLLAGARATDAYMEELGSAAEDQLPHLRQMQRHWISFRDAACDYERSRWGGGSGGGLGEIGCLMTLTARQSLWLDVYLSP